MAPATRFPDRAEAAAVRAEAQKLHPGEAGEETFRLAGRIMGRRAHGELVFLDLVDRSGRIQLLAQKGGVGPLDLSLGDIIGVEGVATRTRRGEPSLWVTD